MNARLSKVIFKSGAAWCWKEIPEKFIYCSSTTFLCHVQQVIKWNFRLFWQIFSALSSFDRRVCKLGFVAKNTTSKMLSGIILSQCVKWAISHHIQKRQQGVMLWMQKGVSKEPLPLIKKQPAPSGTLHKTEGVAWLHFLTISYQNSPALLLHDRCACICRSSSCSRAGSYSVSINYKINRMKAEIQASSAELPVMNLRFLTSTQQVNRPVMWHTRSHNSLHN